MITYENAVCFAVGMVVVYLMFRMMGIYVVMFALCLTLSARAQSTVVTVTNWPFDQTVYSNSVPVTVTEDNAPDRWPAFSAGMAFAFICSGFGWKLRIARNITRDF